MILNNKTNNNNKYKMLIRMDAALSDEIRKAAADDTRSMNSYIVNVLKMYIKGSKN